MDPTPFQSWQPDIALQHVAESPDLGHFVEETNTVLLESLQTILHCRFDAWKHCLQRRIPPRLDVVTREGFRCQIPLMFNTDGLPEIAYPHSTFGKFVFVLLNVTVPRKFVLLAPPKFDHK